VYFVVNLPALIDHLSIDKGPLSRVGGLKGVNKSTTNHTKYTKKSSFFVWFVYFVVNLPVFIDLLSVDE